MVLDTECQIPNCWGALHSHSRVVANALQATDYDKVSSAYANALVDLAQEKNALDTVHADIDSLQVCYLAYAGSVAVCHRSPLVPKAHYRCVKAWCKRCLKPVCCAAQFALVPAFVLQHSASRSSETCRICLRSSLFTVLPEIALFFEAYCSFQVRKHGTD